MCSDTQARAWAVAGTLRQRGRPRGYTVWIWLHRGYTGTESKTPTPKGWRKCLISLVPAIGIEPTTF